MSEKESPAKAIADQIEELCKEIQIALDLWWAKKTGPLQLTPMHTKLFKLRDELILHVGKEEANAFLEETYTRIVGKNLLHVAMTIYKLSSQNQAIS